MDSDGLGIDQGVEGALYVLAHATDAQAIWLDRAAMSTQVTSYQSFVQFLV